MRNDVTVTVVNVDNEDWEELRDVVTDCLDPRAFHADDSTIDAVTETTYNNLCAKRADIARVVGAKEEHVIIDADIIDAYELVWVVHIIGREPVTEVAFIEYCIEPAN